MVFWACFEFQIQRSCLCSFSSSPARSHNDTHNDAGLPGTNLVIGGLFLHQTRQPHPADCSSRFAGLQFLCQYWTALQASGVRLCLPGCSRVTHVCLGGSLPANALAWHAYVRATRPALLLA